MQTSTRKKFWGSLLVIASLVACGQKQNLQSQPDVVNMPHTPVKWQSIGNCWVYAVNAWAESLVLKNSSGREVLNLSESYITYRHFQEELQSRWIREINTGGSWYEAVSLINRYGVMREGDFIPDESESSRSSVQAYAERYLNQSLRTGPLSQSRDAQTIDTELRNAFKLGNRRIEPIPASRVIVETRQGRSIPLSDALNSWEESNWPWASVPNRASGTEPYLPTSLTRQQESMLTRVKRAMNDGYPVLMSWFVDFNALDSQGVFSLDTLKSRGAGHQGYHMVVLEDYTVAGNDPVNGPFTLGEGELSPAEKELALKYGKITSIIIKNSWGGDDRPDRPSYRRDGTKGYHRLDANYLFALIPSVDEKTGAQNGLEPTLTSFVLPPGY